MPPQVGQILGIRDLLITFNYDNYTTHQPCIQIWVGAAYFGRELRRDGSRRKAPGRRPD